jgi:hypothetical protein
LCALISSSTVRDLRLSESSLANRIACERMARSLTVVTSLMDLRELTRSR